MDSGEVSRQIDAAALAWPGDDSRQQLVRRLIAAGAGVAERNAPLKSVVVSRLWIKQRGWSNTRRTT